MTVPATARPRVLFVANDPPGAAVTRYRCENLAEVLNAAGAGAEVAYVGAPRVRVDHDIVVLHRICLNATGELWLKAARSCGAAVVYGADDLVFDTEAFPDDATGLHAAFRRFAPLHAAMLSASDASLFSNRYLAGRAQALPEGQDKPIYVLRNFLSTELFRLSQEAALVRQQEPPRRDRFVIAYLSGSPTHDSDLATITGPLRNVLAARPEAQLLFVGPVAVPAELGKFGGRVRREAFVPWQVLPSIIAGADLCLAPLEIGSEFSHGKSEIKLLEAGAVGVVTLASRSAGFIEAIDAVPDAGVLAATPGEWEASLLRFIDDSDFRSRIREGAARLVVSQGTAESQKAEVVRVFAEIAGRAGRMADSGAQLSGKPVFVNWPVAPPKYAIKRLLEMGRRVRAGRRP